MVSYYVALMSTMFFFGSTIGCVCWGWVADRIGRKTTLLICLLCIVKLKFYSSYSERGLFGLAWIL